MKRGFTIFFAILVSSLALAVGLAIYDLVSRELVLSQTTTQSQFAIFAADTGAECALYWDNKCTPSEDPDCICTQEDGSGSCIKGTAFATSSASTPPSSGLMCAGFDITNNAILSFPWTITDVTGSQAVTTFKISSTSNSGPCATVTVTKSGNPSQTTIVSRGYNTCVASGVVRIERALQIIY